MIRSTHPFIASIVSHLLHIFNCKYSVLPFFYLFPCVNQAVRYSPSILQTAVCVCVCERSTAVDECWVVPIDQRSGGWQSPASLHASLGSIQLGFALCRSGHCWILIPPSNIRSIDFFPEGCFCLHIYWICFKQRGSSICPRVPFLFFFFIGRKKQH